MGRKIEQRHTSTSSSIHLSSSTYCPPTTTLSRAAIEQEVLYTLDSSPACRRAMSQITIHTCEATATALTTTPVSVSILGGWCHKPVADNTNSGMSWLQILLGFSETVSNSVQNLIRWPVLDKLAVI